MNLVTGGSGFVGGHIVEQLLADGETVRVFDRDPPEVGAADVEFFQGDIRDREAIRAAMENVDVVYHNVALVPVTRAGQRFREVNVGGTRNAIQAAAAEDVDRFIHMGSSSVYDLDALPITEQSPLRPKGPYSRSKLDADELVLAADDVDTTVIRPRTVVDRRRAGIFQILFDWISCGKRVYLVGDGSNQFQMVSGRDLADAAIAAAHTEAAVGEVYNVGTDEFGTMRAAYEDLVRYAGTDSTVVGLPRGATKFGMRAMDAIGVSPLTTFHYKTIDKDFYFDITKATSHLDWSPRDSNTDCMRRGYDWYVTEGQDARDDRGEGHRKAPEEGILKLIRKIS